MDQRGLSRKDLQPYIGPRQRVWVIMERHRSLSLNMMPFGERVEYIRCFTYSGVSDPKKSCGLMWCWAVGYLGMWDALVWLMPCMVKVSKFR